MTKIVTIGAGMGAFGLAATAIDPTSPWTAGISALCGLGFVFILFKFD